LHSIAPIILFIFDQYTTLKVSPLVQALQRTNEFEREMSIRFTTSSTSTGDKVKPILQYSRVFAYKRAAARQSVRGDEQVQRGDIVRIR